MKLAIMRILLFVLSVNVACVNAADGTKQSDTQKKSVFSDLGSMRAINYISFLSFCGAVLIITNYPSGTCPVAKISSAMRTIIPPVLIGSAVACVASAPILSYLEFTEKDKSKTDFGMKMIPFFSIFPLSILALAAKSYFKG